MTDTLKPLALAPDHHMPAEWAHHDSVWLAWPSAAHLWKENLEPAQAEFMALCEAIAHLDPVTKKQRGESLNILVPDQAAKAVASKALGHLPVTFHEIPFGDIWLRDTAPVFLRTKKDSLISAKFQFNGWGEKYVLPHDADVATKIASQVHFETLEVPLVLEGGSVEFDGEGTCLTSRQCLLNKNRNPDLTDAQIEARVLEAFGCNTMIWVTDGLINDHTDGHIDTIARFSRPGTILCMKPSGDKDPNAEIYAKLAAELRSSFDSRGRRIEVVEIPSPGAIYDEDDRLMPASYLNFYISNTRVIVPVYGSEYDDAAVKAIAACFPDRETIGLSAMAILSGGGAFHCISQQQPSLRA